MLREQESLRGDEGQEWAPCVFSNILYSAGQPSSEPLVNLGCFMPMESAPICSECLSHTGWSMKQKDQALAFGCDVIVEVVVGCAMVRDKRDKLLLSLLRNDQTDEGFVIEAGFLDEGDVEGPNLLATRSYLSNSLWQIRKSSSDIWRSSSELILKIREVGMKSKKSHVQNRRNAFVSIMILRLAYIYVQVSRGGICR